MRRLRRLAVSPAGRRTPGAPLAVDVHATEIPGDVVAAVDHAGPAAAAWSTERPVGPAAVAESLTGRLPRSLDDDGWGAVNRAFAAAATHLRSIGARPVVALDDDGLLHATLSPLMGGPLLQRALAVVAASAPCDVLVVVEDLAPGGTDATRGLEHARRLVDAAQATTLYATCGTVRLQPLHHRAKGASVDHVGHFLASAAWCVGRVGVPVVAAGRSAARDAVLAGRAGRLGLAGVLRTD